MKINYICAWSKKKELSWSGTNYSLFRSLSERMDICDLGFRISTFEQILIKIFALSWRDGKLKCCNSLNSLATIFPYFHAIFQTKFDIAPQVQIGDIARSKAPYYLYQDLSIDSLLCIKQEDKQAFEFSNYQNVSKRAFAKRNKWQKNVYAGASGIFTMSNWLEENLINYSGINKDKVHHVGGGINIDPNKIKNENRCSNKILFVGRDFKRKAGYQVYEAFKILKKRYMNAAELYIIGPTEYPLCQKNESIKFIGDISSDELARYFNMCDIFCMPSYFEAYGLVFIEALAYGLPCIGRNKFAMKEFIEDGYNGYLVENDNPEKLATKMYALLRNQTIKDNVRLNRDEYIKRYSWDSVAKRMLSVIERDQNEK